MASQHAFHPSLRKYLLSVFSGPGPGLGRAHHGDVMGSIPDDRNKTSLTTQQVLIFLQVEGLAFHLLKAQLLWRAIK